MENDPTSLDAVAQPAAGPAALGVPPATLDMQPIPADIPSLMDEPASPPAIESDVPAVPLATVPAVPLATVPAVPLATVPAVPLATVSAAIDEPTLSQPAADVTATAAAAAAAAEHAAQENAERRKRADEAWRALVASRASHTIVEGAIKNAVKGGFLVAFGPFRGFLPASQSRLAGTPPEKLPGTLLPLMVIDVDEAKKRVVVSHRQALEAQRRDARKALIASLRVGSEHQATVVRLADFGAFVDLGGIDALVPVGELALERVDKPADCVKVGDRFAVRILRVDAGGKKIGASRKAMLPDPWRDHASLLSRGKIVQGTVVANTTELQIEVAPGVVGIVSENEATPGDYAIGEAVEVSVRSADFQRRRLRLSTMHAAPSFAPTSFAPLGDELKA